MTTENERLRGALTEATGRERVLREQEKHMVSSTHTNTYTYTLQAPVHQHLNPLIHTLVVYSLMRPHNHNQHPLSLSTPFLSQTNSHHRKVVQLEAQLLALRTESRAREDKCKSLELSASQTAALQEQCISLERLLMEKQREMEEVVGRMEEEKAAVESRWVGLIASQSTQSCNHTTSDRHFSDTFTC